MRQPSADNRRDTIDSLRLMDFGEHSAAANLSGLERRDPTSDRRLLEFCLAIPESLFLRDGQTCWILKQALGDQLPHEILNSSIVGYQAADWADHIGSAESYRKALSAMRVHPSASQLLDTDELALIIDELEAIQNGRADQGVDVAQQQYKFRLKLLRGMAAGSFIRYVENSNRN